MTFEKRVPQIISVIFHPLLMPSAGLLILFNSGTYLSLVSFDVKKVIFLTVVLSTLVLPLALLPVLYFRKIITDIQMDIRQERFLPYFLIMILYILTFIFLIRIPLHSHIHAYALSLPVMVLVLILVNIRLNISEHMMALGGIVGLILSLVIHFGLALQSYFVIAVLAAGITGTARAILRKHSALELYGGFILGIIVTGVVMLIY
ncbi:MAG: hypothetical protein JXR52_07035 [Bacteroidales bacterium]|nr:hypothetical protein [Bacteroidales bacterium]MBN2698564.1 hypothetical protein [Bacteroidales bacterium]